MSPFRVHDVATLVNEKGSDLSEAYPSLRLGMLFFSTPIEQATAEEKRALGDDTGIKTVLNTQYAKEVRYKKGNDDNVNSGTYKAETWTVENVLDLISCHVFLRRGTFANNHVMNMPFWTWMSVFRFSDTI